jgi:hypothetical protein
VPRASRQRSRRTGSDRPRTEAANTVGMHSAVDYDPRDGGLFWIDGAYTRGNNPNCQDNDWATEYGTVAFGGPAAGAQLTTAAATVSTGRSAVGCGTVRAQLKPSVPHPVCAVNEHPTSGQVHRPSRSAGHAKEHAAPAATRSNPGAAVAHSAK